MWPFFCFYGGKWRAARHYPAPMHDRIFEPFAGAAGYSVRHHRRDVVLVEKDAQIAALWRYLIGATERDILNVPLLAEGQGVEDMQADCAGARYLVGFWLNKGSAVPCKSPSAWMRSGLRPGSFWGPEIRARIASQVGAIKHWTIIEGDYTDAPDERGTWFIDPPYMKAGRHYRQSSAAIDYKRLADWCRERRGQVIVCENDGARWLPFQFLAEIKATAGNSVSGRSREAVCLGQNMAAEFI